MTAWPSMCASTAGSGPRLMSGATGSRDWAPVGLSPTSVPSTSTSRAGPPTNPNSGPAGQRPAEQVGVDLVEPADHLGVDVQHGGADAGVFVFAGS